MTAIDIDKKLRHKFHAHKYELSNSYIYAWESDFFSITTTGYAQEIEIKVSLSDFRADFKKIAKHKTLKGKMNGEKSFVKKTDDRVLVTYEEYDFKLVDGKRVYGDNGWEYIGTGEFITEEVSEYMLSRYQRSDPNVSWKPHNTQIEIHRIMQCPNKFWYVCPTGVIPVDEVPDYAGLYYVDENMRMTIVKKAPFIHKEKQDLTRTLLDKFYWNSKNIRIELMNTKTLVT